MLAGLCLVKTGTPVEPGAVVPGASDSSQSGPGSVLKAEQTGGQAHYPRPRERQSYLNLSVDLCIHVCGGEAMSHR